MTNNLINKSGHGYSSGENVARSSIILFFILFMGYCEEVFWVECVFIL